MDIHSPTKSSPLSPGILVNEFLIQTEHNLLSDKRRAAKLKFDLKKLKNCDAEDAEKSNANLIIKKSELEIIQKRIHYYDKLLDHIQCRCKADDTNDVTSVLRYIRQYIVDFKPTVEV